MPFRPAACRSKRTQLIGRGEGLKRRLAPLFDPEWSDWLPIYAFAIEHPEGVILVDTGANAGLMRLPRWHPYFRLAVRFEIDREQEIGPELLKLGIAPRDVKTVVLTHMHIDHDGGLKDLMFSQVWAAAGELAAASGIAGKINGYLPQRWPSGFDPKPLAFEPKPFGPFASSHALTHDGAVIALPTPGHTDHHVSIAVVEEGVTTLIAGDASYCEANLIAGRIDGISASEAEARAHAGEYQPTGVANVRCCFFPPMIRRRRRGSRRARLLARRRAPCPSEAGGRAQQP